MTVLSPRTIKEEGILRQAPLILACKKKDAAAVRWNAEIFYSSWPISQWSEYTLFICR